MRRDRVSILLLLLLLLLLLPLGLRAFPCPAPLAGGGGFRIDVLTASDFLLPQTRTRVFLRGIRKTFAIEVPLPLSAFGQRHLKCVLGDFEHTPRSALTSPQQANLAAYERLIVDMVSSRSLASDDVVVIAVDRGEDGVYSMGLTINSAPTLTCRNFYLFAMSVGCVVRRLPDHERQTFRWIQNSERLTLQGFPPDLALWMPTDAVFKAAGNAYPVPLMIATMHPLLKAIKDRIGNGFDFNAWPDQLQGEVPPECNEIARRLSAAPKRAAKPKAKAFRKRPRSTA